MQDATPDRVYVRRYLAERKLLRSEAILTTETPDGAWQLYAESVSQSSDWRSYVAIRSAPPVNGSDLVVFRVGHNGQRWENRKSLHSLKALYADMMRAWDQALCALSHPAAEAPDTLHDDQSPVTIE